MPFSSSSTGKVFAGAGFLHQVIFPAAALRARAAVRTASGKIGADHASAGVGHAHRAVHECLQLQIVRHAPAQFNDLIERHFAPQHHALCAHIVIDVCGGVVQAIRLRADVDIQIGRFADHRADQPQIGYDRRVRARALQRPRVFAHGVDIIVAREGVYRYV